MTERLCNIYPTKERLIQEVRAILELSMPNAIGRTGILTLVNYHYLWNKSDDQVNANTIRKTIDLCHEALSMKEESGLNQLTIYHTQQLLIKLEALGSLFGGQLTFTAINL